MCIAHTHKKSINNHPYFILILTYLSIFSHACTTVITNQFNRLASACFLWQQAAVYQLHNTLISNQIHPYSSEEPTIQSNTTLEFVTFSNIRLSLSACLLSNDNTRMQDITATSLTQFKVKLLNKTTLSISFLQHNISPSFQPKCKKLQLTHSKRHTNILSPNRDIIKHALIQI